MKALVSLSCGILLEKLIQLGLDMSLFTVAENRLKGREQKGTITSELEGATQPQQGPALGLALSNTSN